MADGKWMGSLTPATPLPAAAWQVLEARLRVVRDHLPRAAHEADADPEHVHQLRVGTRRADAALRIFRACLPGKVYKQARARLRALRRAAGEARDWDVFLQALRQGREGLAPEEQPGVDFLIGYALGQRVAAQARLCAAAEAEGPRLDQLIAKVLESVRAPGDGQGETLYGLARPLLTYHLHELARAAGGDLDDFDHLHQVRIAAKRLRYAMEVFVGCFGPAFREALYPMVAEVQEVLGRANDSHVAAGRLADLRARLQGWPETWGRLRPGVEGLEHYHLQRLPEERERFLRWWERWGLEVPAAALTTLPPAPSLSARTDIT